MTVSGCDITRNSWDGIALYRGARAHIRDNVIDGVDKAAGGRVGGGRGVGIGLTWDARAVIERNRVTRYWKGIGVFVEADADVRENVVEDILTWGIALWGPDGATPDARIERNIIYRTGACGVMIDRPDGGTAPGALTGNLIVRTGQSERYDSGEPYCWQRPLARHHVPAGFVERGNVLFDNRQPIEAGAAPPPLVETDTLPFGATELLRTLGSYTAAARAIVFREMSAAHRVPPAWLEGEFEDDYGSRYTITANTWVHRPGMTYHIAAWNSEGQYAIARNDSSNATGSGRWTRIDWLQLRDMAPYEWAFCLSAYEAATQA